MGKPLARVRVLVTRAKGQAPALSRELRRLGAQVIEAPAIRIVPPVTFGPMDRALRRLDNYDALVFTSANGVEAFFNRARRILRRAPAKPARLFAIGPGTAKALSARGWRGVAIPETYRGEALASRLGRVKGWRILIPRAAKAREVLPVSLAKAGARVDVVPAYRTVVDPAGARRIRAIARVGGADAVTFTSSSTVESFGRAAGPHARLLFKTAVAASIGPITTATLRRLKLGPVVQASKYTVPGLAQALARHFSRRRP